MHPRSPIWRTSGQMKESLLEHEALVERPLEEVFAFFSNPMNLEALTPSWLKFRVLNPPELPLREGVTIDYALRVRGLPLRWRSLISRWDPPHAFVDEQLRGPYRLWVHTHTFEARGDSTLVRDSVRYAVLGGALVDRLLVRRDLERIFDYRSKSLREALGLPVAPIGAGV